MTQRQSLAALLAQVVVALAALVGATVLAGLDKLNGEAIAVLYGAALALAGNAARDTAQAAINGGPQPDLTKLAEASPAIAERLAEHHLPPPAAGRD